MAPSDASAAKPTIEPIQLLVMANRVDGIVREMTNTLVRTAQSATLAARDLSCSLSTAEHELFAAPEGCPVHVYGSGLLCEAMQEMHPDFKEGDAFLHNDPYLGNTHAADWTILVPVFYAGEHIFTACVKAHQADTGNAIRTTYSPEAVDVYAEGALIFPCVRIQEHYADVGDIIRMCQKRIRIPEIWYGDYLAMIAAARVGEQGIQAFCRKFGLETVKTFVREWLDYSERMTMAAIRELPAGEAEAWSTVDPFPSLPDGIPLHAKIAVDPAAARVTVDFRDNPDCTPTGLNQSRATSTTAAVSGILHILNARPEAQVEVAPNNGGSFRRFEVLLRENCVLGIPVHPYSCSMATTTVLERAMGMVFAAFAQLADGVGLGEPAWGLAPYYGVVSGFDRRRGEPYMLEVFSGTAGGPAGPQSDGWLTLLGPGAGGVLYIDSAEVIEQKYPYVLWEKKVRVDSEGAGRQRGAPGNICSYGPLADPMDVYYSLDGMFNPPQGVRGGGPTQGPGAHLREAGGSTRVLPNLVGEQRLEPGERIVSLSAGGGGYGDALTRDVEAVLRDVVEGFITVGRARAVYGVILTGDPAKVETLVINGEATTAARAARRPPFAQA